MADLMCAADVWCVPSRWEGLGSILIEAMALARARGVLTIAMGLFSNYPIAIAAGLGINAIVAFSLVLGAASLWSGPRPRPRPGAW